MLCRASHCTEPVIPSCQGSAPSGCPLLAAGLSGSAHLTAAVSFCRALPAGAAAQAAATLAPFASFPWAPPASYTARWLRRRVRLCVFSQTSLLRWLSARLQGLAPTSSPVSEWRPTPHSNILPALQAENKVLYPLLESRLGEAGLQWAARELAVRKLRPGSLPMG